MWDIKSIVLFICSIFVVILISLSMANASETAKSKAELHDLYVKAGCMEMKFIQREICKTKVFQKKGFEDGKNQLKNTFSKLNMGNQ